MVYLKRNNDVVEKYKVDFDKERIEKLKNEIVNKCSFIEHKEYESDSYISIDVNTVKNFMCNLIGKKEYFEEVRDVYFYQYDEYNPPYLVELINRLLKDDSSAIEEILNYDISHELSIDDKIALVNKEFIKIDSKDITKRKEKLKEIERLLKVQELNKDQQSIEFYYDQLIGLINFDLIDSISISKISRVESFLEIKLNDKLIASDSLDKVYVKSLKKVD